MNLKLHPNAVKGIEGSKKLLDLTRSYMRKGGFHIQFNIVDSKVLKDAQKHPNNYRDLLVRVAGFTQYLSLIHISEPTRLGMISYAVFCLKKKKKNKHAYTEVLTM